MSDLASWNERGIGRFPGHVGVEFTHVEVGQTRARLDIAPHHLAPNGYLHAGVPVTLADTCSGYGTVRSLPEGATGFTTIELKSNHLGTLLHGALLSNGSLAHGGRSTQVWDVVVTAEETGKKIALFRCTQMILYPR